MSDAWSKASTLVKARLEELIPRVEEPAKVLRHVASEIAAVSEALQGELREHEPLTAQLQAQAAHERATGLGWEQKAAAAIRAARDDLAAEAVRYQRESLALAEALEARHAERAKELIAIRSVLKLLDAKQNKAREWARIFEALAIPSLIGRDPAPTLELLARLEGGGTGS